MKKITVTAFIITSTLIACKTAEKSTAKASTPAPAATAAPEGAITYAVDIKPVMEKYCVQCHNANQKAGYNFFELSHVKRAGANGELVGTMRHLDGYDPMPAHADKLDEATLAKVEAWVKGGMN